MGPDTLKVAAFSRHLPGKATSCWMVVYRGRFSAKSQYQSRIRQLIHRLALGAGLAEVDADDLVLAVDEAIANIIQHAYGEGLPRVFHLVAARGRRELLIMLKDHGHPFNPLAMPAPIPMQRLHEGHRGGLGIYLMRNLTDRLSHSYDGTCNRLVLLRGVHP